VHPSHVAREFRRAYGMTIGECVRKLRVEFVAEQLARPRKDAASLTDSALDAGFSSQAHMAAVFNRVIGMPPGQYRKAHGLHQAEWRPIGSSLQSPHSMTRAIETVNKGMLVCR
jgi:AraC-like DNA-binding protein